MKKSDIFNRIVDTVVDVCAVPREKILGYAKHAEVVDARCIAVRCAMRYGLTTRDIMVFMKRSNTSTIRSLDATYNDRKSSYAYRICAAEVRRQLDEYFTKNMTNT